jgi:opacity protein-like surface antigen
MKRVLLFLITLLAFASIALAGDVYVNGYYRSDGTYVQPHYRSAPDGNSYNNWSTKGNTNPYTGQPGYKNPSPGYGGGYNSNPYNLYDTGKRKY